MGIWFADFLTEQNVKQTADKPSKESDMLCISENFFLLDFLEQPFIWSTVGSIAEL